MWKPYEFLILVILGCLFVLSGLVTVAVAIYYWDGNSFAVGLVPIMIGLILLGNACAGQRKDPNSDRKRTLNDAPIIT